MRKGLIKNILLVFLLTIAVFSVFRYIVIFREKLELTSELTQVKKDISALQEEKQKLNEGAREMAALLNAVDAFKAAGGANQGYVIDVLRTIADEMENEEYGTDISDFTGRR